VTSSVKAPRILDCVASRVARRDVVPSRISVITWSVPSISLRFRVPPAEGGSLWTRTSIVPMSSVSRDFLRGLDCGDEEGEDTSEGDSSREGDGEGDGDDCGRDGRGFFEGVGLVSFAILFLLLSFCLVGFGDGVSSVSGVD
jgi:hypothetical protein